MSVLRKIVYKVLIAILTYINMNYLNKIKVDVNNEQYTYENIFNQKKNITNLENNIPNEPYKPLITSYKTK